MAPQASTSAALAVNTMIIRSLCLTGRFRYRVAMFMALLLCDLRQTGRLDLAKDGWQALSLRGGDRLQLLIDPEDNCLRRERQSPRGSRFLGSGR